MLLKLRLFLVNILLKKEVDIMAKVFAALVIKGEMKFSEVAPTQKEKVRQLLIALECEELINE